MRSRGLVCMRRWGCSWRVKGVWEVGEEEGREGKGRGGNGRGEHVYRIVGVVGW